MGMPQIPHRPHKPNLCEVVISLIESVAIEELAIAHIMNAEGEKLQEVIKKFSCLSIDFCDLHKACKNTTSLMNSLIMKEWILLSKMNQAIEIYQTIDEEKCIKEITVEKCKQCGKTNV